MIISIHLSEKKAEEIILLLLHPKTTTMRTMSSMQKQKFHKKAQSLKK